MSPEAQIVHGAVFGPLLLLSFVSMATDSDAWPFFFGSVLLAVASFKFFAS